MSFKGALKHNPTLLLVVLLIVHMGLVSLNRLPDPNGQYSTDPSRPRFIKVWLMAALAPFQTFTVSLVSAVSTTWHRYFELLAVAEENRQLREKLNQLQDELNKVKEEAKLAEQLRALVNWQKELPYQVVVARVIARDANQWFNTVVINRGSLSGINRYHPVVTPEGVVGRVTEVAPNASRVLLITDERHGAGAIIGQLAGSRARGVIKGKSEYLCEMSFLAGTIKIEPGELVLTSGQDMIYPPGLVIGRVKEVQIGSATTPYLLKVEPSAPLAQLDQVGVLLVGQEQIRRAVEELEEIEKQEKPPARKKR